MKGLHLERWRTVVAECDLHIDRIRHAHNHVQRFFPLSPSGYDDLSADDITYLDQLVYRYTKLQDVVGEKLFPLTLILLGEQVEAKPFIDILNRLERLELIPSRAEWTSWRELRNDLAHEYPGDIGDRVEALNALMKTVWDLIETYGSIKSYMKNRSGR
ncbi:hypothetical protein SAMN06295888_11388 [Desulfonatronum zhilinae]|nr:hypothetical protein SAMN06295888_11388 [Desulfonatronum zhilinae]